MTRDGFLCFIGFQNFLAEDPRPPFKIRIYVINFSIQHCSTQAFGSNGRRNVSLNSYIIDKFAVTLNGFVCIRILGGHSFL